MIVDTRSDGEYCGTTVRAKRGGAVPGAVHIEWTRNLGPDGAFKPAAELREMYESAGVTPDREVMTYCQGGYRAAHSLPSAPPPRLSTRAQLRGLVEGVGRPGRFTDRSAEARQRAWRLAEQRSS